MFPCIAAVAGAIFLLLAKQARPRKWESYELTEKVFLVSAIDEVLLASAMFLKGVANLLAQTVIPVLWVVICISASYRYSKTEKSV